MVKNIFSLVISVVAIGCVIVGISKINDDYNKRYFDCDKYFDVYIKSYENCVADAWETHNKEINAGWGFAIVGGIVFVCSMASVEKGKQPSKKR